MTGWMLCVISHIRDNVLENSNIKHHIQVNTVIKNLIGGQSEKELYEILDTFWSEYKKFNHENYPFESNKFIQSSKDIYDGNSNLWHQKHYLPYTKVLGVVSYKVTSKMIGVGSVEYSWVDVKTIKSRKISDLGSDISENQSIVYTHACIEKAIIGRNLSNTYIKDSSRSQCLNDQDHVFGYQVYQWGVEKMFQHSDEVIIRELKVHVEDRGEFNIKNKSQLSRTMFIAKYGSLYIYGEDPEKLFMIDHGQLKFDKNDGWTLFLIFDKLDGTLSGHETFLIHDDIFDRTKPTDQDKNIMWKFYQMNQMKMDLRVKQHRYVMTGSKIRRKLLAKNHPSLLFRERGRNFQFTIETYHLMTSG